jgi:hypothetical protein
MLFNVDNKNNIMNKRINFEDTIFILNVRIRMIRDLLHLDTDIGLFLHQTMKDLEFINSMLDMLSEKFLTNIKFMDRETEADNLSDAEWQFSQIINEVSNNTSPFSPALLAETQIWIDKFRKDSAKRQKQIEEAHVPIGQTVKEPVVSNAELNGLLSGE